MTIKSTSRKDKKAIIFMIVMASIMLGGFCGYYFYGAGAPTWTGSNDSLAPQSEL